MRPAAPLAVAVVAAGLALGVAGPSYAIDGPDCTEVSADATEEVSVTEFVAEASPADALHTAAAQDLVRRQTGRTPGEGVTVAVLDSGIQDVPGLLDVTRGVPAEDATRADELVWPQGTLMAGIIAAAPEPLNDQPVGIAPGARLYDQQIYDTASDSDDGLVRVGPESVAAGLEAILPVIEQEDIRIVAVGVGGDDTPRLRAAVRKVTRAGVIIVAGAGSRDDAADESPAATYTPGEDWADRTFPAGYAKPGPDRPADPRVLSVTTTAAPGGVGLDDLALEELILFSSAIDVAVPTAGAVSVGLNGAYCSARRPSTAAAAAEVSGILALLMTAYPDDSPEQLIARLETTASGSSTYDPGTPNTQAGKGVVQPLEALTRPVRPSRSGALSLSTRPEQDARPAALPVAAPDVLASTRANAVWWGLFGGGALLVLMLLRPVLARRR